jgi:(p)ppGpp synthase/HD superfamily hydrolase
MIVAQTKIQLFHQLLNSPIKYSEPDLRLILKTFEFGTGVFAGRFQTCGKPFLAHGIGTASILAHLHAPAVLVAAGIIHNVSSYGELGFGVVGNSRAKSKYVRKIVGQDVEQYVSKFPKFGIHSASIQSLYESIPAYSEFERDLLLLSLAENLEKLQNCEPLFNGNPEAQLQLLSDHGLLMVQMCERIGYPSLAASYTEALQKIQSTSIPAVLRQHKRLISFFLPTKTFFRRSRTPIVRVKPN